ncbi:aldehyde dehydrogenase [Virgibacillus soli]|uniref:aldehyde dehydrogenase n=1 Tax=Paracerasibacillus soli TaxID=480284 RepID=UPI0035E81F2F
MTIETIVEKQRSYYLTRQTADYGFRMNQLKLLKKMLQKSEIQIYEALEKDLHKSRHESLTTELGFLYTEIDFAIKHLKTWMKPEKVDSPLTHKGSQSYILREPYGVTLIISPWNYPLQLSLSPAIGAIAAGNTIILKPSEFSSHVSKLLHDLIQENFSPYYFTVIQGDKQISEKLLQQKFDYIFFTGSTNVGKIVMEAASKHVTPITLELGGKSPVIIDCDANIDFAAKRIVWGKFTNAGQTCVAPDYIYVHHRVKKKLVQKMMKYIRQFYGRYPLQNKEYVKIITNSHLKRLEQFLHDGEIICGGQIDEIEQKIEPTIIDNVTREHAVMQEEIFGPILPIITFTQLNKVLLELKREEKPLALYYFGENKRNQNKIMEHISFGGGCINDVLYHLANPNLPFGGVGASGLGAYHGRYSFDTFSHRKSVLNQTTKFDLPFRYPGSKLKHQIVKRIMK